MFKLMSLVVFLIYTSTATGQVELKSDAAFLTNQLKQPKSKLVYYIEKTETNEIKMGVQLFFLFYKNYFSSQDTRRCAFSPSCSTYCLHSVQKRGVLKGLMGAFDRLSRCNYLSPENYRIDLESGQLIDPVE